MSSGISWETDTRVLPRAYQGLSNVMKLARPQHWIKSLIVLAPLVFAHRLGDIRSWSHAGLAAIAFSLASSAVYIINDIRDRYSDRMHPQKRNRPLAAGKISRGSALAAAYCRHFSESTSTKSNTFAAPQCSTYCAIDEQ